LVDDCEIKGKKLDGELEMLAATVRGTLGVAVQQILIDPEAKR